MVILPLGQTQLSSEVSCFTQEDLFDSENTDLSAIKSPSIDNLKLVTSYAVSAHVDEVKQQLLNAIDNIPLSAKLDSSAIAPEWIQGEIYEPIAENQQADSSIVSYDGKIWVCIAEFEESSSIPPDEDNSHWKELTEYVQLQYGGNSICIKTIGDDVKIGNLKLTSSDLTSSSTLTLGRQDLTGSRYDLLVISNSSFSRKLHFDRTPPKTTTLHMPNDGLSGTLARDIDLQPALQPLDTWTFEPSDSSLESDGFSLVYDDSAPFEQAHRWILSYNAAPTGTYFEADDYFNDRNATSLNWQDCRLVDEATGEPTIEFSVQCIRDTELLGYKYCNKMDMLLLPAGGGGSFDPAETLLSAVSFIEDDASYSSWELDPAVWIDYLSISHTLCMVWHEPDAELDMAGWYVAPEDSIGNPPPALALSDMLQGDADSTELSWEEGVYPFSLSASRTKTASLIPSAYKLGPRAQNKDSLLATKDYADMLSAETELSVASSLPGNGYTEWSVTPSVIIGENWQTEVEVRWSEPGDVTQDGGWYVIEKDDTRTPNAMELLGDLSSTSLSWEYPSEWGWGPFTAVREALPGTPLSYKLGKRTTNAGKLLASLEYANLLSAAGKPLVGLTMPAQPDDDELIEAVKKIFIALGGEVTDSSANPLCFSLASNRSALTRASARPGPSPSTPKACVYLTGLDANDWQEGVDIALEWSRDDENWQPYTFEIDGQTATGQKLYLSEEDGEEVYFRAASGGNETFSTSYDHFYNFNVEDYAVTIDGNVLTLIDPDGLRTDVPEFCFGQLFSGCGDYLVDASALELPATELGTACYLAMFSNCIVLESAPELPATELAPYCYQRMFAGCSSLTVAPELPAQSFPTSRPGQTNPAQEGALCYSYMFAGCSSLTSLTAWFREWSGNNTEYWLTDVASNGTFFCSIDLASSILEHSASTVPEDWEIATTTKILFSDVGTRELMVYDVLGPNELDEAYNSSSSRSMKAASRASVDGSGNSARDAVVSLTAGTAVTAIGDYAFTECNSLSNVVLAPSVSAIGSAAFLGCTNLENFECFGHLTALADDAINFNYAAFDGITGPLVYGDFLVKCLYDDGEMHDLVVPDGVKVIMPETFYHNNVSSVTLPQSLCEIRHDAFYGSNLVTIDVPDSVSSIAPKAFEDCESLISAKLPADLAYVPEEAFAYSSNLTAVVLPPSAESIEAGAFNDCFSLVSVDIPSGVLSIGQRAFMNCYSLPSVLIPDRVTDIMYQAFDGCSSLTAANIPSSVLLLGGNAFHACSSLTEIVVPDGVPLTAESIFTGCRSLSSVSLPSTATKIPYSIFWGCYALSTISIPSSVTFIDNGAFDWCSSLVSIDIPAQVSSIENAAFRRCSNLSCIVFHSMTAPSIVQTTKSNGTFGSTNHLTYITGYNNRSTGINKLYVPEGAVGYDQGSWLSVLLSPDYGGFTLVYGQPT